MNGAVIGGAAAIAILIPVISLAGGFTTTLPSGDSNVILRYENITQSECSSVNWMDVYAYDYVTYQNDFSNVTDSQIRNSVDLFFYTQKEENPNYNPKDKNSPKYIYVKMPLTLDDVMKAHGFTSDQMQMAEFAEQAIEQQEGADGGTGGDVAVPELRFAMVSDQELYNYVHARGSIFSLSDIDVMIQAGQSHDINPVLLLAITGQEESFVPASWPSAPVIRNNPWNVYYSWQNFNTNIVDTANIAAETLHNKLVTPPPSGEDAIHWINDPKNPAGIYAQDTNWANGVEAIFHELNGYLAAQNSSK